ncbi:MAG: alpha/beta fold hydrolase [Filomicrobium sp.]
MMTVTTAQTTDGLSSLTKMHASQTSLAETSYDRLPTWQKIARFFPQRWHIPQPELPEETTYFWRGCSVHVDRYENASAPVRIILLHGLGTNARIMTMIAGHALAKAGHDVAAIDMPYVGATTSPHRRFEYKDWIQLTSDFINKDQGRDDRPVVLFGFSVGGMLSYDVSCINHRVAGVCGSCFIDLNCETVRREIADNPGWSMFMEGLGGFLLKQGLRFDIPLKTFASPKTISNDPRLNEVLADDRASLGGAFPLAFLDSIRQHKHSVPPSQYDLCPVALFQCELDRNIPPSTNTRFVTQIAGETEVAVLPEAGHIPLNIDALEQLAGGIDDFSKRCTRRKGTD